MKSELTLITLAAMATVGSIPDPAQAGDTMPAQKARERWECRLIFGVMLPDIEKIDPR